MNVFHVGLSQREFPENAFLYLIRRGCFFPSDTTISGIIKKLRRLKRQFRDINDDGAERAECQRIEYFDLSESEIDKLIIALMDLNGIAELFYADFNDQNNDFKVFYGKIREVLVSHVLDARDIDDEFKDIVQRVLVA